jgi:hypothetical protein
MDKMNKRKREALEKISKTKELKRKIVVKTKKLVSDYNSGKISSAEYKKKLKKDFSGRTPQQWVDYYEGYLKVYNYHLKDSERRVKKEKVKPVVRNLAIILAVLGILALLVVFLVPKDLVLFAPATYGPYTFDTQTSGDELEWIFTGPVAGSGLSVANTAGRWSWDSDATTSADVGPDYGVDGNPDGYIYTEMSSQISGDDWYLEFNQDLDASINNINVEFYWAMRGDSVRATIQLQTSEGGGAWIDRGAPTGYGDEIIPGTSGATTWWQKNIDLTGLVSDPSTRIRFHIVATADPTGDMWHNDVGFDSITIIETSANSAPSDPTDILCNGGSCDISVDIDVDIEAIGSIDTELDSITYYIEALLESSAQSSDLETGSISKAGQGGGTIQLDLEDWELYADSDATIVGSDWINVVGDDCDWMVDSAGTPSTGTGPDWDNTLKTTSGKYFYIETSSGYCQTPSPGSASIFESVNTYDADAYDLDVSFWYHMLGSTMGTLYFEVYDGTWNTEWSISGQQHASETTPYTQAIVDLSAYSGIISFRFRGVQAGQYYSDFALDDIEITGEEIGGSGIEDTTDYTEYLDVVSDQYLITNINVEVEVTSYDNSASTTQTTTDPDLQLEVYSGSDWVFAGDFGVSGIGIYDLDVTNPTVLTAWLSAANQDIRIRGIHMDYVDVVTIDEIIYENVFVTIDGAGWSAIGSHAEGTPLNWDTSLLIEQAGIDLRARAIDETGSNQYSGDFIKGSSMEILHGPPVEAVNWDTAALNLGPVAPGLSTQDTSNVRSTLENTNVVVQKISGETFITASPTGSLGTLIDAQQQLITFTCAPEIAQPENNYQAIYRVTSDEDPTGDDIIINCNVATPLISIDSVVLDDTSYTWFGDAVITATVSSESSPLLGGIVEATIIPLTGRFVYPQTMLMHDDGVAPDATADDGIYTVKFDISLDGSAETSGTHDVEVTASKVGYTSDIDSSQSFNTFVVRRWFGSTTADDYADYMVTETVPGVTWHHDVTEVRIFTDSVTQSDVIVKFPILNQDSISNLVVTGSDVLGSWIENNNVIVINMNVGTGASGRVINFEFDSSSDLIVTHQDKVSTVSGIGSRETKNGFVIWNRYFQQRIFGIGLASEEADASGLHAVGENIDMQIIGEESTDSGLSHTIDCMERLGTPWAYDGGSKSYETCVNCGSYYEWNIHWKNPQGTAYEHMGAEIISISPTQVVFKNTQHDSTDEWASTDQFDATKHVTYYSGERYYKTQIALKNIDSQVIDASIVWGREPWIYQTGSDEYDTGAIPNQHIVDIEEDYTWDELGDNWFITWDDNEFYGVGIIFPDYTSTDVANNCQFFDEDHTPIGTGAGQNTYPWDVDHATMEGGLGDYFCDWHLDDMAPDEERTIEFYHWGGTGATETEMFDKLIADAAEIKGGVNTAPTVTITSVDADNFVDFANPGATNPIEIIFDVEDMDGVSDIDETTLSIQYTYNAGGEATRTAGIGDCNSVDNGNVRTYTCDVDMEFYDAAGVWTATVDVDDLSAQSGQDTQAFNVNLLRSISLNPGIINIGVVNPGQTTKVPTETTITNIGNSDIPTDSKLQIISQNLIGATNPAEFISGSDFQVADESVDVCASGQQLSSNVAVDIPGITLLRGASSTRNIQYCVSVQSGLSSQDYSAVGGNAWELSIVVSIFLFFISKKKDKSF